MRRFFVFGVSSVCRWRGRAQLPALHGSIFESLWRKSDSHVPAPGASFLPLVASIAWGRAMVVQLGRIGRLFVGAAFVALTSGGASAADLPLKAPAAAPIAFWFPDVPMFGDAIFTDTPAGVYRGGFKIAENESPRPLDRVYFNYNYFNAVDFGGVRTDIHRETFGFEKTFLNGNASIGLRIPVMTVPGRDNSEIGDISAIFKYAFINDGATGNVLSAGLVITAPTGPVTYGFDTRLNQTIHPTFIQPFVAGRAVMGNFFVQGFSSIALPTDSRDVTYLFNDIGVGYFAYRGGPNDLVQAVSPVAELHVNTPFKNDQIGVALPLQTELNVTGGLQVDLKGGFGFGAAIVLPVITPRPFNVEAQARLNFRF
jgi:hypothetical protein